MKCGLASGRGALCAALCGSSRTARRRGLGALSCAWCERESAAIGANHGVALQLLDDGVQCRHRWQRWGGEGERALLPLLLPLLMPPPPPPPLLL